ncbi:MAG: fructose-6-phosphate aldolase [Candidatus Caldarchaeum sp.]
MKLFLDTGSIEEVREAVTWGILDGVTTNPSLIAKSGKRFRETVLGICELVPGGAISAEVVATEYEGILREAREIASWHPQIVVKIPMIPAGIRAVRTLSAEGIRTNVTLVFSVPQALLAAKAGATFISNFVGRVDDVGGDGMSAVAETVKMIERYGFSSEVLVASVRHPRHVVSALQAGAHICTMPLSVMRQLFQHPLTDIGLKRFLEDWHSAGLEIFEKAEVSEGR